MAEILESFPDHLANRRGRTRVYKEEWFDGKPRKFSYIEDLHMYKSLETARVSLQKQAIKRGYKVKIAQHNGYLYFQVVSEEVYL